MFRTILVLLATLSQFALAEQQQQQQQQPTAQTQQQQQNQQQAGTGALDLTFGTGGKVERPLIDKNNDRVMTLLPNGDIVVGGYWYTGGVALYNDMYVSVFSSNGTFKRSFKPFPRPNAQYPSTILAISNERVLLAGEDSEGNIYAVNPEKGLEDRSFGANGIRRLEIPAGEAIIRVTNLVSAGAGKVWVVGSVGHYRKVSTYQVWEEAPMVSRITESGSLDTSFNNGQPLIIAGAGFAGWVRASVVDPQGRLVVASTIGAGGKDDAMFRVLPSGELDESFGVHGVATVPQPKLSSNGLQSIALDLTSPEYKIAYIYRESGEIIVGRLLMNGSIDSSFGDSGVLRRPVPNGNQSYRAVFVDSYGRITVTGYSLMARFRKDMSPDTYFGQNGILTLDRGIDMMSAVRLPATGRILLSGYRYGTMQVLQRFVE